MRHQSSLLLIIKSPSVIRMLDIYESVLGKVTYSFRDK